MTLASAVTTAFAASTLSKSTGSLLKARTFISSNPSSPVTPLQMSLVDYTGAASGFFSSVRIPAALISGSSLAALFTLADQENENKTKLERCVWFINHVFAMISLMLSLNVVVTATATGNEILLGFRDPLATSAYALLKREYNYEFMLTRWSFFTSLFSFLACIGTRALLEFKLLQPSRRRSALFCVASVGALFFHVLSFVNQRLVCWPHMGAMTLEVFRMYFKEAFSRKTPMELLSLVSACTAFVTGCMIFTKFSNEGDAATKNNRGLKVSGGGAGDGNPSVSQYSDDDQLDEQAAEIDALTIESEAPTTDSSLDSATP